MHLKISPEKALFIDRLLKSTKTELITLEVDTLMQIVLTSPDMSHMTVIKFEASFFEEFSNTSHLLVGLQMHQSSRCINHSRNQEENSINRPSGFFYVRGMKELRVEIAENKITFEHTLPGIVSRRSYYCLSPEVFDIGFSTLRTVEFDMAGVKRLVYQIKDKEVVIGISSNQTSHCNASNHSGLPSLVVESSDGRKGAHRKQEAVPDVISFTGTTMSISMPCSITSTHRQSINKRAEESINKKSEESIKENESINGSIKEGFTIETEKLKRILLLADSFYETALNIPAELTPVNFIYRLPDVFLTTFISTEPFLH